MLQDKLEGPCLMKGCAQEGPAGTRTDSGVCFCAAGTLLTKPGQSCMVAETKALPWRTRVSSAASTGAWCAHTTP